MTAPFASLWLQVDTKSAVGSLDAMTRAADRANEALTRLGEHEHGGIIINVVGDAVSIQVQPKG